MRIIQVVRSDGFAGVERHVVTLALAQSQAGHEVVLVGGDPQSMRAATAGSPVRFLPARTTADVVFRLLMLRRTFRPDVVHAHMTAAEFGSVLALPGSGIPLVVTRHFARLRGSRPVNRAVSRVAARRVQAQIAISCYVADHVEGSSVVIHPGVISQEDVRPAVQRDRVVLVAQRLEPEKETREALDSFARSGLAQSGWVLTVAGAGSERGFLERLAVTLGVSDAVRFLGHRSDVQALMERSAILLAPCPVEGLGMTVLEAMALAVPVVATAAGGHLESAGSVPAARLYRPGDTESAAHLMSDLANDPPGRDEYGLRLRSVQRQDFSIEHQVRQTDELYRSLR